MRRILYFLCVATLIASSAFAQATPPPHKIWDIAASAGLAQTSGNADTTVFNAAYNFIYDPLTKNIVKSDALFIRGTAEEVLQTQRFNWNVRDQYRLNGRTYVFGQNQYLHDKFKNIDYLIAPTGGIGYSIIKNDRTTFDADGGVGGVLEKNPGFDVRSSGAVTAGERIAHKLTDTTTLTQSLQGLWKTNDWEDALYTFGAGIAVAINTRVQLKVELLDIYKNKPPLPTIKKNDLATLIAVVFRN